MNPAILPYRALPPLKVGALPRLAHALASPGNRVSVRIPIAEWILN